MKFTFDHLLNESQGSGKDGLQVNSSTPISTRIALPGKLDKGYNTFLLGCANGSKRQEIP